MTPLGENFFDFLWICDTMASSSTHNCVAVTSRHKQTQARCFLHVLHLWQKRLSCFFCVTLLCWLEQFNSFKLSKQKHFSSSFVFTCLSTMLWFKSLQKKVCCHRKCYHSMSSLIVEVSMLFDQPLAAHTQTPSDLIIYSMYE